MTISRRAWPTSVGGWVRVVYFSIVAALAIYVAMNLFLGFSMLDRFLG